MMSRRIAVSMIVVLLVGSATWGDIFQGQGFGVGTDNIIHLTQGDQSGHSMQNMLIDMSQSTEGAGQAMLGASVYGVSSQGGTGMGALGQIGVGSLHVVSVSGLGGIVAPVVMPIVPAAGSASLQLAKARLASLMLGVN